MEDINFFDFKKLNVSKPSRGKALIAEPFLDDTYFKRSVVYLCDYSEKNTFGFVLNNYTDIRLSELNLGLPDIDTNISIGGPVDTNSLFYIHTTGHLIPNSRKIKKNIFIGGDFDILKELLLKEKINKNQIRFFLGYSGWGEHQLDEEINQNAWIVTQIDEADVMNSFEKNLWKSILKKKGKKYSVLAGFPEDPALN
jgi:putative transcriptional regulator